MSKIIFSPIPDQICFLPILILVLFFKLFAAAPDPIVPNTALHLAESLSQDSLRKHLFTLADDSMMGRATGTRGAEMAAHYIQDCFRRYGLKSPDNISNYLQPIPMHGSLPLADSRLRLYLENTVHDFELADDYLLYRTGAQTYIGTAVPMVFAGYGINAPEFDYNDYQSIDVTGKIVVCLSGEPESNDSTYFSGCYPTIYSLPETKHRMAISRGALGTILIASTPEYEKDKWNRWKREFTFEDVTLSYTVAGQLSIVMSLQSAELLFHDAFYSLNEILSMVKHHRIKSFPLPHRISFKGEFIERDFISSNVIGIIEGNNPELRDSFLIITAHYDHLGIGPEIEGDPIYNGAFDNAAGVAGLLEIARIFSQNSQFLQRSVIFMAVTGEEKGLLGSKYYLDHPAVPLYKTVANINIDGLAIFEKFNDIIGIGAELSTLEEYLQQSAELLGLRFMTPPNIVVAMEAFSRSDQLAFAQAGIPSLLIMEGMHCKETNIRESFVRMQRWLNNIYHTPQDDLNQEMNLDASYQHLQVIAVTVFLLSDSTIQPEWKSGISYKNVQLQNLAEKR
ncbi:MAG: M28 family peptidase [Calditrichaeota bacterium]|nr:MAG: M28 family peptidase [Calditrichota bacterium]